LAANPQYGKALKGNDKVTTDFNGKVIKIKPVNANNTVLFNDAPDIEV